MRILLVEDNPGDVRLTTEALQSGVLENNLLVAADGLEAITLLQSQLDDVTWGLPDLILLDLNLPRKNGLEFLAELKANEWLKHIPVMVLSSSEAANDQLKAAQLKADRYLTKPADFQGYRKIIEQIESFCREKSALTPAVNLEEVVQFE